jgi:hypothetical protein
MSAIGDPAHPGAAHRFSVWDALPAAIGVAGWFGRAWSAIVSELAFVDCGSLDVLLLCTDEIIENAPPADAGV